MLILAKIGVTLPCLLTLYAMSGIHVRVSKYSKIQTALGVLIPAVAAISVVWSVAYVWMRG